MSKPTITGGVEPRVLSTEEITHLQETAEDASRGHWIIEQAEPDHAAQIRLEETGELLAEVYADPDEENYELAVAEQESNVALMASAPRLLATIDALQVERDAAIDMIFRLAHWAAKGNTNVPSAALGYEERLKRDGWRWDAGRTPTVWQEKVNGQP